MPRTLTDLDDALLSLLRERARAVAEAKAAGALDTFEHERRLIDAAQALGDETGLDLLPLVTAVIRLDVHGVHAPTLTSAERSEGGGRVATEVAGEGAGGSGAGVEERTLSARPADTLRGRALVIGGGGRMGGWMAKFLAGAGWSVTIADPVENKTPFPQVRSWRETPCDHDLIVVAAPLRPSNEILHELASARPQGLVFDVGSLKSPLRSGLHALRDASVRVTSVHPMFGPDVELLHGRHVIFIDLGDSEACEEAASLFEHTAAKRLRMTLDEHDRVIAYILGLSHALNIAFVTAIAESGEAAPRLADLSSTTFEAQLDVARRVVRENPHLYFEIQSLNDYGTEALSALSYAVEKVRSVVRAGDEAGFVRLMEQGDRYVRGR